MKLRGMKVGQIQWILFWAAIIASSHDINWMWGVWLVSLLFDDKNLYE